MAPYRRLRLCWLCALCFGTGCADSRAPDARGDAAAAGRIDSGTTAIDAAVAANAARAEVNDAGVDAMAAGPKGGVDAAIIDAGDVCQCSLAPCPDGSQWVRMPGQCCPVCRACDPAQCADLVCDRSEEPYVPPGQCCATACQRSDVDSDAYGAITLGGAGTCEAAERPSCNSNGFPGCAPDWETALRYYDGYCPGFGPYLARCEHHDAIVNVDPNVTRVYLFDRDTGRLVGLERLEGEAPGACLAYESGFASEVEACEPLEVGCSPNDVLEPPDAGIELPWPAGVLPSCEEGQAAYDTFLAEQLAQYNTCVDPVQCNASFGPGSDPSNPCRSPCDLVISPGGINSQILYRLDTFGFTACALCLDTPPECPLLPPTSNECIDGYCVQPASNGP